MITENQPQPKLNNATVFAELQASNWRYVLSGLKTIKNDPKVSIRQWNKMMDSALKASKKTYKTPLIEMINARCVGTMEFIDGNSLQLFFILKNHDDELPEMQREMFHHLIQAWVNGDEMEYYNISMQEWLADKSINESLDRALNVLARMYVHNVRPEFYSELNEAIEKRRKARQEILKCLDSLQ